MAKKNKDPEMDQTRQILKRLIETRYKRSFSQRLGDFFETILSFIVILGLIILAIAIVVMFIENPLSLLILFVGIALIMLIRSKK